MHPMHRTPQPVAFADKQRKSKQRVDAGHVLVTATNKLGRSSVVEA